MQKNALLNRIYSGFTKRLLIMKLTAFFMLVTLLQVHAGGYSQTLSISVRKAPVEKIFLEIEKQSEYRFFYNEKLLKNAQKITLENKSASLKEVLDLCFKDQPFSYMIDDKQIVVKYKQPIVEEAKTALTTIVDVLPPDLMVTGKVTSENGVNMRGATIKLKGQNKVIAAGEDGSFSIQVPEKGGVLEISFIGYNTKEISVKKSGNVSIVLALKETKAEEIVIVGYGTRRKKDFTGSVSKVSGEELTKVTVPTIDQALQGRAAGVMVTSSDGTPGGAIDVRIRGISSLQNNDPLYVVDGAPTKSGIGFLNPGDIESIDILKDASSNAIYGVDGRNGVVIITTKRGKSGTAKVTLDSYSGLSKAHKQIKVLGPRDFAMINLERLNQSTLSNDPSYYNPAFLNPASLPETGTDWQDAVFRTAMMYDVNLGISGGSDKTTYSFSFGHRNQEGIIKTTGFKRYNLRANIEHRVSQNFKLGGSFNYSITNQTSSDLNHDFNGVLQNAIQKIPTIPVFNPDGSYGAEGVLPTDTRPTSIWGFNFHPLAYLNRYNRRYIQSGIFGNVYAEAKIIEGLRFRSQLSFSRFTGLSKLFISASAEGTRTQSADANSLTQFDYTVDQYNWDNTVSYDKTFAKVHVLNMVAGTSTRVTNNSGNYFNQASFSIDNPSTRYFGQGSPTALAANSNEQKQVLFTPFFARLNYIFNDKYYLTGTIRRDGSSTFGASQRFGNFPSAALAWKISNENFMKKIGFINDFKIRASWGITGDPGVVDATATRLGYGPQYVFGGSLYAGVAPTSLGNPDLRWEETTQRDLGFDASFFKNKLSITFDYYQRSTDGLIIQAAIPAVLGNAEPPFQNIGGMKNSGLEFTVTYQNKIGKLEYSISANASTLKNEVTSLGDVNTLIPPSAKYQLQIQNGDVVTRSQVGQPISFFYGYFADGVFQTPAEIDQYLPNTPMANKPSPGDVKFRDINGDGKINPEDRAIIGNSLPKFIYGFNINLSYNKFDFSAFLQGVAGNQIYNGLYAYVLNTGRDYSNYPAEILQRWTGPGTSNSMPRVSATEINGNGSNVSTLFLESGAYARLRNLQLGYTLSSPAITKAGFSKVRFYISAQNLFTISKYRGYDPEIGTNGGRDGSQGVDQATKNLQIGVDRGGYPQPRSFLVGINLAF